jgi:hypothetical protein
MIGRWTAGAANNSGSGIAGFNIFDEKQQTLWVCKEMRAI